MDRKKVQIIYSQGIIRKKGFQGTKALLIMLAMLMCSPAAADEWTRADTYREAAYLTLHAIDWGQTLYIADHPNEYYERNTILGDHPSRGRVNTYFILSGLGHAAVSYVLPRPYREIWQYGTIAVSGYWVINNYHIGIQFGF